MSVQLRSNIIFIRIMLILLAALNERTQRRKYREEDDTGTSFRLLQILRLTRKVLIKEMEKGQDDPDRLQIVLSQKLKETGFSK